MHPPSTACCLVISVVVCHRHLWEADFFSQTCTQERQWGPIGGDIYTLSSENICVEVCWGRGGPPHKALLQP